MSEIVAEALSARRGARVEVRAAERGEKRRILELASRNAALALEEEQLKAARRRERRAEALDGLRAALRLPAVPMRIECFDISNLQGTHSVASMVVFEAGVPKRSDYRRFRIRTVTGADDFASLAEVLGRRMASWERQVDTSPHDSGYDASFAALPNLIVIDGGKGQLSATLEPLAAARAQGVAVISLAKRLEEVFVPGRPEPIVLSHESPELQLLARIRDEAHRVAITHHRSRRDRAMTASLLDDLPGRRPRAQARADRPLRLPRRRAGGERRAPAGGPGRPGEGRPRAPRAPAPRRRVEGLLARSTGERGRPAGTPGARRPVGLPRPRTPAYGVRPPPARASARCATIVRWRTLRARSRS